MAALFILPLTKSPSHVVTVSGHSQGQEMATPWPLARAEMRGFVMPVTAHGTLSS